MMGRVEIVAELAADRSTIALKIVDGGREIGKIEMDAGDLQGFIRYLGMQREQMDDPVPLLMDPGSRLELGSMSSWQIPEARPNGGIPLAIRHRGYGWLGFLMEPEVARELAQALHQAGEQPPP